MISEDKQEKIRVALTEAVDWAFHDHQGDMGRVRAYLDDLCALLDVDVPDHVFERIQAWQAGEPVFQVGTRRPQWTSELPTEPGWYLWRSRPGGLVLTGKVYGKDHKFFVVFVINDADGKPLHLTTREWVAQRCGQWLAISVPE